MRRRAGAGSGLVGAYLLLSKKAYRRSLQYPAAHMVKNAASVIFGLIYIAVWQAAARGSEVGPYNAETLGWWVAFNQALLWVTVFLPYGLGIPEAVRTGAVSLEMLRPLDFHLHIIARELGTVWYNLWFRTLPLAIVFALVIGAHAPKNPATYPLLLCAVVLAVYIGLCQQYLVGIAAFWTVESRWAWQLTNTLQTVLSGFMVPIDLLPARFFRIARLLPFAPLLHDPASVYLEFAGAEALVWPLIWAVALTIVCRRLTACARRRLESQ